MTSATPDPVLAMQLLRSHLQMLADAGVPRIQLTPEARASLKHLIRTRPWKGRTAPGSPSAAATGSAAARPAVPSRPAAPPQADAPSGPALPGAPPARPAPEPFQRPAPSAAPAPAPVSRSIYAPPPTRSLPPVQLPPAALPPKATTPAPRAVVPESAGRQPAPAALSREERQRQLDAVRARAQAADQPRLLGTLREKMVFATGNPEARIMFVGEAPGFDEERLGEPFVGRAGQLLDKIIKAAGMERSEVYISNICKFRPAILDAGKDQGTANRKPTPMEMDACIGFLREEIAIVRPEVIVALGATAAEGLLGLKNSVSMLRAKFHDLDGTPVMITFHPSYLLRNPAPAEKRKVWEDMLKVMERMDLPISEKQRAFFLSK